jgi:hypothetical protein
MRHGGDPEVREGFVEARQKQVAQRKLHGSDKRHNILDIPRTSASKSTSVNLAVRGAEVDLIPEESFLRFSGGKSFKQCKLTPVNIGGKEGILVYASSWNPPPGCWRIAYSEMLSVVQELHLADSNSAVLTHEVLHSFNHAASDMQQAANQIASELVAAGSSSSSSSSVFLPGSAIGGVSLQPMLATMPGSSLVPNLLSLPATAGGEPSQQSKDKVTGPTKRRMPSLTLALRGGNEEGEEETDMHGDGLSGDTANFYAKSPKFFALAAGGFLK